MGYHDGFQKSAPLFTNLKSKPSIKSAVIPKFMVNPLSQISLQKTFNLNHLQDCTFFSKNQTFRHLVNELKSFNCKMRGSKSHGQITNFVRKYYLHQNLYERLKSINSLCSQLKQAIPQIDNLALWLQKQKKSVQDSLKMSDNLPRLNLNHPKQDEEHLRKTMVDMKARREYEQYQIMSRTANSEYFKPKENTLEYKQEQNLVDMSECQTVYSGGSEHSKIFSSPQPKNTTRKKSIENLSFQTTGKTSKRFISKSNSAVLLQNSKFSNKKQRLESTNAQSKKSLNSFSAKKASSFSLRQRKVGNFHLIDDLIKKDKLEKVINSPDCQSNFPISRKQNASNPQEMLQFKGSKVLFLKNKSAKDFVSRGSYQNSKVQSFKDRFAKSRSKTDLNRKLQFRRYMSNKFSEKVHISKRNTITSNAVSSTPNVISMPFDPLHKPQCSGDFTKNNAPRTNVDLVSLKKKAFEDSIRKQTIKQTVKSYQKYIGKVPEQQRAADHKEEFETEFNNFFKNPQDIECSRIDKTFKSQIFNNAGFSQILDVHSKKHYNLDAVDKAQVYKLHIRKKLGGSQQFFGTSDGHKDAKQKDLIRLSTLRSGLGVPPAEQGLQVQSIAKPGFNNPFFVVKKPKKGGKKGTKKT